MAGGRSYVRCDVWDGREVNTRGEMVDCGRPRAICKLIRRRRRS